MILYDIKNIQQLNYQVNKHVLIYKLLEKI